MGMGMGMGGGKGASRSAATARISGSYVGPLNSANAYGCWCWFMFVNVRSGFAEFILTDVDCIETFFDIYIYIHQTGWVISIDVPHMIIKGNSWWIVQWWWKTLRTKAAQLQVFHPSCWKGLTRLSPSWMHQLQRGYPIRKERQCQQRTQRICWMKPNPALKKCSRLERISVPTRERNVGIRSMSNASTEFGVIVSKRSRAKHVMLYVVSVRAWIRKSRMQPASSALQSTWSCDLAPGRLKRLKVRAKQHLRTCIV